MAGDVDDDSRHAEPSLAVIGSCSLVDSDMKRHADSFSKCSELTAAVVVDVVCTKGRVNGSEKFGVDYDDDSYDQSISSGKAESNDGERAENAVRNHAAYDAVVGADVVAVG